MNNGEYIMAIWDKDISDHIRHDLERNLRPMQRALQLSIGKWALLARSKRVDEVFEEESCSQMDVVSCALCSLKTINASGCDTCPLAIIGQRCSRKQSYFTEWYHHANSQEERMEAAEKLLQHLLMIYRRLYLVG